MPYAAPTPCRHKGCAEVTRAGYCDRHLAENRRRSDEQRGSAAQRGYGSKWRKQRLLYLARNPLCRQCNESGRIVPATVVDHIIPHRGDAALMWNWANWQALCKPCHDRKTAAEDGGFGNRAVPAE